MPKKFFPYQGATVAVVLLLFTAFCTPGRAQTAEEMASYCKGITQANVFNEGGNGTAVDAPTDVYSGICWGAFLSFQSAISYVGYEYPDGRRSLAPRPFFGICAVHTSTSQLIKVFVHYTDEHPEKLNQDFFQIALAAGKEAFPCKNAP